MQPVKLAITESSHMWSVKLAMPQTSHLQPIKMIDKSNHKKFQVKSAMVQSTHMQSMSKADRRQSGTQPEVVRNSKHAVLSTHVPYNDNDNK